MIRSIDLFMENLIENERQIEVNADSIIELFAKVELEANSGEIFKAGPVVLELKPSEANLSKMNVKYYIPLSYKPKSLEGYNFIPNLHIHGTRDRVLFDENILDKLNAIKTSIRERNLELKDKLYIVLISVFDDLFVDLIVPVED